MLVLDSAYLVGTEPPVFRRIAPAGEAELQALVERLAERIGRALERRGVLVRDAESSFLELEPAAGGAMADLLGHSIHVPRSERTIVAGLGTSQPTNKKEFSPCALI
jgi:hypothetical protein